MRRSLLLAAALATAAAPPMGCAGRISGEIDGESPGSMPGDFWFYQYDGLFGSVPVVVLSSRTGACDAYAERLAGGDPPFPDTYWTTAAWFFATDDDALVDEGHTPLLQICRHGEADACWYASSGSMAITGFDTDGRIAGEGDVDLVDESGDDAGQVSVAFSVPRCEAVEAHLAIEDLDLSAVGELLEAFLGDGWGE